MPEPITFGPAGYLVRIRTDLKRLEGAAEDLRVGKISGAVGTFAHIGPEVEEVICRRLDLTLRQAAAGGAARPPCTFHRDAGYLTAGCEKIALGDSTSAAHGSSGSGRVFCQRPEGLLGDAAQAESGLPANRFADWRAWSGPMRRRLLKILPCGMSAIFRILSVERVILPDSTILADYLLAKMTGLVDKMFVYPERMRRNLEMTKGLVFSGQLLLDLSAAGMARTGLTLWFLVHKGDGAGKRGRFPRGDYGRR